jgi:hypothetical protein
MRQVLTQPARRQRVGLTAREERAHDFRAGSCRTPCPRSSCRRAPGARQRAKSCLHWRSWLRNWPERGTILQSSSTEQQKKARSAPEQGMRENEGCGTTAHTGQRSGESSIKETCIKLLFTLRGSSHSQAPSQPEAPDDPPRRDLVVFVLSVTFGDKAIVEADE